MAKVDIFDKDNNKTYSVTVNLNSNLTQTDAAGTQEGQGIAEYYLTITTTLPQAGGTSFPAYIIKTLDDVPDGFPSPAASWNDLIEDYIEYFQGITIYASTSSTDSTASTASSASTASTASSDSSSSSSDST